MEAERRSYCWVQIKETSAKELEADETGLPKNCYHEYQGENGTAMQEYHVDIHSRLQDYIKEEFRCYGGNLSVRKNEED